MRIAILLLLAGCGPAATPCEPVVTPQCTAGWCTVPAGCFEMGSPLDEPCRVSELLEVEETPHRVELTHPFAIQQTEVTQGAYRQLTGSNPSHFLANTPETNCTLDCPVESVAWEQAVAYCQTLGGRLPTEAEWEYAARAGAIDTPITQCEGTDPAADAAGWYLANSKTPRGYNGETHPVAQKAPNAWGLYDMAGNVWEWCQDTLQRDLGPDDAIDPLVTVPDMVEPNARILRGGTYLHHPRHMRAAARIAIGAEHACPRIGFRCVKEIARAYQ